MKIINPYVCAPDSVWLRGNLHMHTEGYVRAKAIREDGAQAWTQPFRIE